LKFKTFYFRVDIFCDIYVVYKCINKIEIELESAGLRIIYSKLITWKQLIWVFDT